MLISAASAVASTTNGPISPTTLPPVVNRPTPMTVPAVMVMASRRPSVRLRPTAGSFCAPPSFGRLPMGVPFSVPTVLAGRRAVACPMIIGHATAPCGYDEITLALYRSKAIGILECEKTGVAGVRGRRALARRSGRACGREGARRQALRDGLARVLRGARVRAERRRMAKGVLRVRAKRASTAAGGWRGVRRVRRANWGPDGETRFVHVAAPSPSALLCGGFVSYLPGSPAENSKPKAK